MRNTLVLLVIALGTFGCGTRKNSAPAPKVSDRKLGDPASLKGAWAPLSKKCGGYDSSELGFKDSETKLVFDTNLMAQYAAGDEDDSHKCYMILGYMQLNSRLTTDEPELIRSDLTLSAIRTACRKKRADGSLEEQPYSDKTLAKGDEYFVESSYSVKLSWVEGATVETLLMTSDKHPLCENGQFQATYTRLE